ncbi:hypothetical protein HU200_007576 [Digitaria exilis]|uniref:Uncharacterized protein n=1 Tax=Digitaria exilis TaxID=1010633 RepID=A0A835FNL1_9POAL|nr:hypothetical protein HU200_007576 [Digitaria exilis]
MLECHKGGSDPTRSSKRNVRTDDLTRTLDKNKRRYLTRSSTKNKTICNVEETTGSLISGEKRFFACTGFFIKWNGCTTILTSASLIRDPDDNAKILENIRVICVDDFCSPEPAIIRARLYDSCKFLAVGCCFKSGMLMASAGHKFPGPLTFDCQYLGYSDCRITKAGIGGPLLKFDGTFAGMNFYDEIEGTPYLNVAEGGHAGKKSRVLDWTMDDDDSYRHNRWPVPKPIWCHPDDVEEHKSKIWRSRPHRTYL